MASPTAPHRGEIWIFPVTASTNDPFWVVTFDNDDKDKPFKAHGPYKEKETADAFKDGVAYVNDSAIGVVDVVQAPDAEMAVATAIVDPEDPAGVFDVVITYRNGATTSRTTISAITASRISAACDIALDRTAQTTAWNEVLAVEAFRLPR